MLSVSSMRTNSFFTAATLQAARALSKKPFGRGGNFIQLFTDYLIIFAMRSAIAHRFGRLGGRVKNKRQKVFAAASLAARVVASF